MQESSLTPQTPVKERSEVKGTTDFSQVYIHVLAKNSEFSSEKTQ